MKAGRELDALIAEKVIRLINVGRRNTGSGYETHLAYYLPSLKEYRTVPHYSTQIAEAWPILDGFESYTIKKRYHYPGEDTEVGIPYILVTLIDVEGSYEVDADTAPLAICLAVLKAAEK